MTKANENENSRIPEINELLCKLSDLCKIEPEISIICTLYAPDEKKTTLDQAMGTLISRYSGDTYTQVNQIQHLIENEPQFLDDLMIFLDIRIKALMKANKTSGNHLADQLLASLTNKNTLKN